MRKTTFFTELDDDVDVDARRWQHYPVKLALTFDHVEL